RDDVGVQQSAQRGFELCCIHRRRAPGARMFFDRMQAKVYFSNDTERAVAARHQLVKIVSCYILDDLATGLCDSTIGEHYGHTQNEIAQPTVSQPQCAAVI